MATFTVKAMVHVYHVYQAMWDASNREEIPCVRGSGNPQDPYAVAIVRASVAEAMEDGGTCRERGPQGSGRHSHCVGLKKL